MADLDLLPPTVKAVYDLYAQADRSWRTRWAAKFLGIVAGHLSATSPERERDYLGMSVLGDECEAKVWLAFRWAFEPEHFEGRMKRLFETGHLEEARVIADLDAIGVRIIERDPATGEQWFVEAVGGHVRGHTDGRIDGGLREAPKTRHLFENKTHNAKSFEDLKRLGVKRAKPQHFTQMQGYMHLLDLKRAAYFAVNKDTDEWHLERVEYDPVFAAQLMAKAERLVTTDHLPTRLHDNPDAKPAWKCRCCPALGVCHGVGGAWARRNCRTCIHASAMLDGAARWHCVRHNRDLTLEEQRSGCGAHLYLPDLVAGKQVDADEQAETISYVMRDGSTWVDGA